MTAAAASGPGALPTGPVTFLFTDIVGSTRLWERAPEAMRPAISRHDTLISQAVSDHGGVVFKKVGDGIYGAFSKPEGAVAAAAMAQSMIEAEPWDKATPLAVRMALHTGYVEPVGGDYVGPPLNRCARLVKVGHGGQVLLSRPTADLARGMCAGLEFLDLGSHRLSGIGQPERIYQVVGSGLPGSFPPLATTGEPRTNLPSPPSVFIGRENELSGLAVLLAKTRLLTITGPGGAGKTRLALELARAQAESFTDGVWFVEVVKVQEGGFLAAAVAHSLGMRPRPGIAPIDAVVNHLQGRHTLLVLDNCEHLVGAAAELVAALLQSAPRLSVLVTSRERLAVGGEMVWTAPPMSLPKRGDEMSASTALTSDAVRLFVKRAKAVSPDFEVTEVNAVQVAETCASLDAMPLALELAAARLRTQSLGQVVSGLSDKLGLLGQKTRDPDPRHRTLRAAIDYSHDLLTEEERELFRRISVFSRSIGVDGVLAVAGKPGSRARTTETLGQLADKSLLMVEPGEGHLRYCLLETLHEYAAERLEEAGEGLAWQERHAAHFLDLAERAVDEVRGPDAARWLARLEAEHDNLKKAMRWCLESAQPEWAARLGITLREFWQMKGHWREGQELLNRCVAMSASLPKALCGRIHHAASVISAVLRDYDKANPLMETAVVLLEEADDRQNLAHALIDLGQATSRFGDYERAEELVRRSERLYRETDQIGGIAEAQCVLAQIKVYRGDKEGALAAGKAALDLFQRLEDQYGCAWVLSVIAECHFSHGEIDAADAHFREALVLGETLALPQFIANGLQGLGEVALVHGNLSRAGQLFGQSLAINHEMGDKLFVASVLASLGNLAAAGGRYETAAKLWGAEEGIRATIASKTPPPRLRGPRYEEIGERYRADARAALGAGFVAALEAGQAFTMAEAVAAGQSAVTEG